VITRRIWFYDGSWQPIDPEYSNSLEAVHLELFFEKNMSDYITDPCSKTFKAGNKPQSNVFSL
jgi:hypothetical protein